MSFIRIEDVALRYGGADGTLAVQGCTLAIERGEFAALVGPSGCGKSTLLKMVSGLELPSAGSVRLDGHEVAGPQHGIGIAFQNATLLPWRTTLDNVLLPLEVSREHRGSFRRNKAEHVERARGLLRTVGLDEFREHAPYQLSGGMQQRANLCRALIHEPDLLLLDEPFAALDAFTREELWGVLQQLFMDRRFTVILVTHDLRESVYLADTVHVVSKRPGRIVKTKHIDLPRPRTLEMTFEPGFVDIVHELRDAISEIRGA
ncbi:MAG TPA: ABC transporter ATP-binding protein [Geminicoccaceae bacterium]|nr:ABC transporter ATP-binding protein [Geminicoccaceae bacterium]